MTQINLKKYYYYLYPKDTFIEVSDEVAEALLTLHRAEEARNSKIRYHKAYYSLDCDDGIENYILDEPVPSPEQIMMEKEEERLRQMMFKRLLKAVARLPPAQARRIHQRYLLGMSVKEIARADGVETGTVYQTLRSGLKRLQKFDRRKEEWA